MTSEFDQYADDYDAHMQDLLGDVRYYADQKARLLKSAGLLGEATRVLDFGCGTGSLSIAIAERVPSARIDGFDVSRDSLARIPNSLKAQGRFETDLSALDGPYDLIVLTNVMHHIEPADRDSVLSDAAVRLAPGGALSIIEHNPINPLTRKVVRDCPFDENAILLYSGEARQRLEKAVGGQGHVRFTLFFPARVKALSPLESLLGWCPLGAQYLAHIRKKG